MSFASMKRNRGKFKQQVQSKLEQNNKGGGFKEDTRMYYPEIDKQGNGMAVIRFLPPSEGEDVPWIKLFNHGFKGPGGWLIENCPTTIEKDCPVCKSNSELWNSGIESDKDVARSRKRKVSYYANILVVKDSKNPENEGTVRIFRFGQKIFDKLMLAMNPEFDDEEEINPFDFWEGANFKLKIRKVEGQTNYDTSTFESPSEIAGSDEEIEELWNKQHKLQELIAADKFKDGSAIEKRLNQVLGRKAPKSGSAEDMVSAPARQEKSEDAVAQRTERAAEPAASSSDEGYDESMDYFNDLANS